MAYKRVNWKNFPDKTTKINADNLNKMDVGIEENDKKIGDVSKISDVGDGTLADAIETLNNNLANNFAQLGEFKKVTKVFNGADLLDRNRPNGFYYISGGVNYPQYGDAYGFLTVDMESASYGKVIWQSYSKNDFHINTCVNGSWQGWKDLADLSTTEDYYLYEANDTFDNVKGNAIVSAFNKSRSKQNGHLVVLHRGYYVNHVFWTYYGQDLQGMHMFSGFIYTLDSVIKFKYHQNNGFWMHNMVDSDSLFSQISYRPISDDAVTVRDGLTMINNNSYYNGNTLILNILFDVAEDLTVNWSYLFMFNVGLQAIPLSTVLHHDTRTTITMGQNLIPTCYSIPKGRYALNATVPITWV